MCLLVVGVGRSGFAIVVRRRVEVRCGAVRVWHSPSVLLDASVCPYPPQPLSAPLPPRQQSTRAQHSKTQLEEQCQDLRASLFKLRADLARAAHAEEQVQVQLLWQERTWDRPGAGLGLPFQNVVQCGVVDVGCGCTAGVAF